MRLKITLTHTDGITQVVDAEMKDDVMGDYLQSLMNSNLYAWIEVEPVADGHVVR